MVSNVQASGVIEVVTNEPPGRLRVCPSGIGPVSRLLGLGRDRQVVAFLDDERSTVDAGQTRQRTVIADARLDDRVVLRAPVSALWQRDCTLLVLRDGPRYAVPLRSEEHTSELQSLRHLVCRLLLEKKK